ncbi:outer membrane beta-barrel protein [Sphingobacterium paucimobilis]|uniref:Outer membrane protein beta-barrel domain-containing protein n=1 Tax=Sphingobacterium paucimobilis HER1398 TaxID=1346330 RepID=U2HUE9_9SPHI|nr:outer membrane beta-barrel protein [Sphingobacterium paucimobilis]ERJ58910.1 hypothetical protein M472_09015 [Sphingobacterium paucimobilis HER1398]
MKKQLTYGLLLAAMGFGLNQETKAQEVDFGFKIGGQYHMPSFGSGIVKSSDSKFGVQAGAFVRTKERLYGQVDLGLSLYKYAYKIDNTEYAPKFYQLNLPIQLGYRVIETDNITLRTAIGAQLNYQLKKNKAYTNNFNNITYDGLINIGTDIKQFSIDLKYSHGINKLSKELEAKNRVIGLSVGYRF